MLNLEEKALKFSFERYKGIKRKFGNMDYINHPLTVATFVYKYKSHEDDEVLEELMAAAYLHDVLEPENVSIETTFEELVNLFGDRVANLVLQLTSIPEMINGLGKKQYLAFSLQHMTTWALTIKLCDRLANIIDYLEWTFEHSEKMLEDTKFILDYIETNRKLTKTNKLIIKDIRKNLNEIEKHFENAPTPQLRMKYPTGEII